MVTSGHAHDLVVVDGDRVQASGEVVAVPGRPVRLCTPLLGFWGESEFRYCELGISLVGADLRRLYDRQVRRGVVHGYATIIGIYRHQTVSVESQSAHAAQPPSGYLHDSVPCPRPPGGWLTGPDRQPSMAAALRYRHTHPGSIVMLALLNPSRHESLAYILTAGDPAPVRAALASAYKQNGFCVQRSTYTAHQIAAARRLTLTLMQHNGNSWTSPHGAGGLTLNDAEQPATSIDVGLVDKQLADIIDQQPQGIIEVSAWIAPAT